MVRKVMKLLAEEGYIRTSQELPSVVTYRTSQEAHAGLLVQNREEIADTYKRLGLLMPVLYRESAKRCNESDLCSLHKILNPILEQMELPDHYQLANSFFTALLRPLKNLLIIDLALDSEIFLHVPHIPYPDIDNPFATTVERTLTWFSKAIYQIEHKQFDDLGAGASKLYCESKVRVNNYLYVLSKYTGNTSKKNRDIRWFGIKGHSELYARLAMTFVRRIIAGELTCSILWGLHRHSIKRAM